MNYWEIPLVRSLEDIIACVRNQTYSCVHPPLLDIDVSNIVLDELHLMLVTGKDTFHLCFLVANFQFICMSFTLFIRYS